MDKEIKWILVNSILLVSLFFGFQRTIQAQNAPVITAATVMNAVQGQQVAIPITVSNFKNIGSVSLSLDYDPTKLHFESATPNLLLASTFIKGDNVIANDKHRLIMGWYDISNSGISLPDGAMIVNYVFTYLSGSPTLQWYEDGPSCDITDLSKKLNDTPTSTYYKNGLVCGTLPNTVSITGTNTVYFGQTSVDYSVPLDPTISYNWSYSGTGATIVGTSNVVKINFSPTATTGTLTVTASNACSSCSGSKDITFNQLITPTFTTGPTNVDFRSSGNVYTTQSGKANYIWTVTGGTITAGGTVLDNSATISWNTTGNQSVGIKYDDQAISTPVTIYPVTVNPAVLTITGITANKVYDGAAAVSLNIYSASLSGVFEPDVVTINAVGATGTFGDKNVGTGKQVTTSGFTLSGTNASNYVVTSPIITGGITPASLMVSSVTTNNKTYDGTNTATLNIGNAALLGVLTPDQVALNSLNATGTFPDKNAGLRKTVITTGFNITGTDADNYSLIQPFSIADISPVLVTITGLTANNKVYDGTTVASLNTVSVTLTGVISPDTVILYKTGVTGDFSIKNIANGITVTTKGFTIGGANEGNYTLIQPVTKADIIPATLTISGLTANKVYSGTVAIALNTSSIVLVGVIPMDFVSLNITRVSATFADKNIGTGKIVNTGGFKLDGASAGNYVLASTVITGNITPATLTISGIKADNKTYDGSTVATLNTGLTSLMGKIELDDVTLLTTGATGTFASKNAASGIKVITSGFMLGGLDKGNYILIQPTAIASIIPDGLSINIEGVIADNKVYDGTTVANLNTSHAKIVGVIPPDVVYLDMANVTGTFIDKNAGNGKTIETSGFSINGTNAGNYALIQPLVKADILPFASPLTISGLIANSKKYDGTTTAFLNAGAAIITGKISTDIVTLNVNDAIGTFADKNAATGKQVTTTGFKLEGIDAINYTLTQPSISTDIKVAPITVTGITASNKIYDGTTTAILNAGSAIIVGVIFPDDVILTSMGAIGTFADKNTGPGKIVTPTGLFVNGVDAKNYIFNNPSLTADILPKSLKITAKDDSKCFGLNHIFSGVTYTTEGLENNDAILNVILTSNGNNPTAITGTYNIVPVNATGTGLLNYSIIYVKGVLTVNPFANQPAEFLISTSTVCKGVTGVSYSVTNDPVVTYNWSYSGTGATIHGNTNAVTLDFSASVTSGILSVTASTSCGTSVARTFPITVKALKNKSAIVFVDNILISNVGEGNQWYKNMIPIPGANGQNYTPTENGKYFNVISNNCYPDTSNFINVIITKTIQYMNNSIQIFPNPTKEYFTLRSTDPMSETMRLSIFSSACILIKNYEINNKSASKEYMIDVRHLSPGLYFVRIDTGHNTITKKLIIL